MITITHRHATHS